jgi:hypothetical protein
VAALVAGPALAAPAAPAPGASAEAVAVGRIVIKDGHEGYVIAEFPFGRRLIAIDKRHLWEYQVGDEIRLDAAGRVVPPRQ